MKIAVVMKLGDMNLKAHIEPLSKLDSVDEIIIIRDKVGPDINKVRYVTPSSRMKNNFLLKNIIKIWILLKICKKDNPELVKAYLLPPHGVLAFIGARISGKPVSISVICSKEMDIFGKLAKRLFYFILKNSNHVTVPGLKTKQKLIENNVDGEKIKILPHAVDISIFKPIETQKEFDIITVTRFDPVKNISTLIMAVSEVKKQLPNVKVGIAGSGQEELILRRLVEKHELKENVIFLGFLEDVNTFYPKGKIFILTSTYEGVPFTVLEAMASGVPCIVSNVGDIGDITKSGENAIEIQDPMDVKAYSKAILNLLNNEDMIIKLTNNGLTEIQNHHLPQNVTTIWSEILGSVEN